MLQSVLRVHKGIAHGRHNGSLDYCTSDCQLSDSSMTIADVHFAIGKTHKVCQDYGMADDSVKDFAQVVICDGCSSSEDTDWGARLLARSQILTYSTDFASGVIRQADRWRASLGLAPEALDATLLVVQETVQGDVEAVVRGDGIVVARRRDGRVQHWSVSFTHNAPAYLSYLLSTERLGTYLAAAGLRLINGLEPNLADPGDSVRQRFSRAEYDMVLIMSDGAESFQKRQGTCFVSVPLEDVIAQVMDFKIVGPGFIKRRMGRFLTKFCPENGWHHNDDFTVAGIAFDP